MAAKSPTELPFRVGVFDTVSEADRAVDDLLAAGFTVDQITVVCSEESIKRHFARFEHQDPAGTETPAAAIAGGVCGAALGGLAAVAGAFTLGGAALLAAGGLALWTGGVVGGLVGAMMTRGVEKELANFYDQSVTQGKILVAAEAEGPADQMKLARASEILAHHGVQPLALPES
ncbi:MAG TPA: hypothetical protein VGJ16_07185 [Pirellulales bacterium]|jgi:hypothetical protein